MKRAKRGELQRFLEMALTYAGADCLLWPYGRQNGAEGYAAVWADGRHRHAHRVVCERVYGAAPSPRHQAAHWCGNKICVAPQHLRWATRAENEADKVTHGRSNRGDQRNGNTKLTEADVRSIRAQPHRRLKDLAAEFGVAVETISHIRTGARWQWVKE